MTSVQTAARVIDLARYPLTDPGGPAWQRVVSAARRDLAESGCCVLRDFVPAASREALRAECASLADRAYYGEQVVNVYNTAPDPALPDGHPARMTMVRGNAFVARDLIPGDFLIRRLYASDRFRRLLADCFAVAELHPLADPLAGLTVNIVRPGMEHPWHFDTNEFAVSLVTQAASARDGAGGGEFQYCPNIRSAAAENFADVAAVLRGDGEHLIRRLPLHPGDLQLFHGRHSLHRVSPVRGALARHSAIFAYTREPGIMGTAERSRQLFGRTAPEHAMASARPDDLLD
ncbi:MAG: arpA protein [Nocardiopsaceae bacterium]|nr:arpA protein [Nocardiopsaceae bacterium]